jgi:tetratricopeptide (TPR) repeat protein
MNGRTLLPALIATLALVAAPDGLAGPRRRAATDDPLALARLLLRDGFPERALAALAAVDPEKVPNAELCRLRGLAAHALGRFAEAATELSRALEQGEDAPSTWYALVSAQVSGGAHAAALDSLRRAPAALMEVPGTFRLQAAAHHAQGDKHRAFEALEAGHLRFPADAELERQRARLLLELGLFQEGLEAARAFLRRPEATAKDHSALAAALLAAGRVEEALRLLEAALLTFPGDVEARKQLARSYFEAERPLAAAMLLAPLAHQDGAAALHAAELFRRAGKPERALRMNALVVDQRAKVRQRLDLLIELERYEEAAALDPRLERLGLLEEERLVYALAYAHFSSGHRERTEALLGRLSSPELFAKGAAIRRALEACERDVWRCE